ncbi:MAG: ABC transporter permease [Burkholderiales bacterium]|nr:ABC transporter permease [Burkholderiales bacterium]
MTAGQARREATHREAHPVVKNRVLLVLVIVAAATAWGLAFLTVAPNRLLTGTAIPLAQISTPWRDALLLPAVILVLGVLLPQRMRTHAVVGVTAALLLSGLVWLAGAEAARLAKTASATSRTALGGGFWLLALIAWLAAGDAIERLRLGPVASVVAHLCVLLPVVVLLFAGELQHLSLLKEYSIRKDVFFVALARHVQIVVAALLPTLLVGIPLGIVLFRHTKSQASVFAVLNVIQTVPSIALFGLLMVPLALLATALPGLRQLGVGGIGMAPAVIALILYSLLPIVRSTVAGLAQVPRPVVDAAVGMGLTQGQVLRKVELPIALPVFLSGVRIAGVQAVGLAVVAALIGAGGLGALVFQGLASGALDLVLLGVIPVVALAVVVDAVFRILENLRSTPRG